MDQQKPSLDRTRFELTENDMPRPLRVVKKQHKTGLAITSSQPSEIKQELGTLHSPNQPEFVASRKSSIRRSKTQVEILSRSPATLATQSFQEADDLNVRKQRRNLNDQPGFAPNVSDNVTTYDFIHRLMHPGRLSPGLLEEKTNPFNTTSNPTDGAKTVPELTRTSTRAVTTGPILTTGLLHPLIDGPSVPLSRVPSTYRKLKRSATIGGFQRRLGNIEELCEMPDQEIKRRPSLRQRFLPKVLGGRGFKQEIDHAAPDYAQSMKTSNEMLHNRENTDKYLSTSSAKNSDISSTRASPPSLTRSLRATTMTRNTLTPVVQTRPSSFLPFAVTSAEISTLSETDRLDSVDGRSIFIAVEVKGTINTPSSQHDELLEENTLDVAVIIDNSVFASPATLLASCETARHLASLLELKNDRIALLVTSTSASNGDCSKIILPLSAVNTRKVKTVVDTIASSTKQPENSVALECARGILVESTRRVQIAERSHGSFGHIFFLTSNLSGVPSNLLHHSMLHIHIVCPGSIPWQGQDDTECNGWKLRSLYQNELEYSTARKDLDPTSLFNRLRNVITQARAGPIFGKLTDLVLEVNAGYNCSIQGFTGSKHYASLRPGELKTVFFKVRVGSPQARSNRSVPIAQGIPSARPTSFGLLDELDVMLGARVSTALAAKVKYKHSIFANRTWCSVSTENQVRTVISDSSKDMDLARKQQRESREAKISVQKRLIFYLATHQPPSDAIVTLRNHFGDDGSDSVCPEYIKLVIEELKYQARVFNRFESCITDLGYGNPNDRPHEHFGKGLFKAFNFKPLEWFQETFEDFGENHPVPELASRDSFTEASKEDHFHQRPQVTQLKEVSLAENHPNQIFNSQSRTVDHHGQTIGMDLTKNAKSKDATVKDELASNTYASVSTNVGSSRESSLIPKELNLAQSSGSRLRQQISKDEPRKDRSLPTCPAATVYRRHYPYQPGNPAPSSSGLTVDETRRVWSDPLITWRGENQRQLNEVIAGRAKAIVAEVDDWQRVKERRLENQSGKEKEIARGVGEDDMSEKGWPNWI